VKSWGEGQCIEVYLPVHEWSVRKWRLRLLVISFPLKIERASAVSQPAHRAGVVTQYPLRTQVIYVLLYRLGL
jgi:hypothetical protein